MNEETAISQSEILKDIGRSSRHRVIGDDRETELMRLAHDPLLLRAFIERQAAGGSAMRSLPPAGLDGTQIYLSSAVMAAGVHGTAANEQGLDAFGWREVPVHDSLAPFPFVPTVLDRASALSHPLPPGAPRRSGSRLRYMAAAVVLVLLLRLAAPGM